MNGCKESRLETRKRPPGIAWKGVLVVAAILIVVIVASINYAFQYVRESANQRQCLANLKQLWSASMMYAQDYDGWMPVYRNSHSAQQYQDLVGFPAPEKLRSCLDKYVKDQAAWFCPSAMSISPRKDPGVPDYRYSTYIFRFCKPGILRSDGLVEANLVAVKVPWDPGKPRSDGRIKANRRWIESSGDPRKFHLIGDDPFCITLRNGKSVGPHRDGVFNNIYLDGHVESLRMP